MKNGEKNSFFDQPAVDHGHLAGPARDPDLSELGLDERVSRDDLSTVIVLVRWIFEDFLDFHALRRGAIVHVHVLVLKQFYLAISATNALVLYRAIPENGFNGKSTKFALVFLLIRPFPTATRFLLYVLLPVNHYYHKIALE